MTETSGDPPADEVVEPTPAELIEVMRTSEGTARQLAAIALFAPAIASVRRMVNARRLDKVAADEVESGAMWRLAKATQPNGGYEEQDDWKGFVASTVRHAVGDIWRSRTRKPTSSLDELQEEQGDAYAPASVSAEEAALALATEWQMLHAFTRAGIASKTAEICIRYYVHGQPYEEIVADPAIGGTVGAARVATHRAMKKMKETYASNPDAIFNG